MAHANAIQSVPVSIATLTAASAGATGLDMDGTSWKGILLFIDVTAISGTSATLTVTLKGIDATSGADYTILASAGITATGLTVLRVYPGLTASANAVVSDVLPPTFRVDTTITGTGPSVTATISGALIY